jgi:serine/threonine-protein kinase
MPTGAIEVSRIRTALADRYRIEHVLGEGGMATVYLAEDLKHHRKVAVKVMRPELAETLGSERFLREVEIAAKLSHPNILPVYDSGEARGILYYVMPLVEGESLPARLAREKQLPVGEALRIAREVAEALGYAHARGIVHRDIKPANILINAGHAMVADFGIARATESSAQALTQTGLAIGTPQYMSPEQASGDPSVDGRTDIYALGCVLYEMLAGEPPFTGPTAQAIISRSITEMPRPLQQTRTALSPAISSAVFVALAKAPADRFATATEMAAALTSAEDQARFGSGATVATSQSARKWWPSAIAALVAIALGVEGFRHFGHPTVATARSVAVLPFANQGPASEAYFAEGIVDELRDKLANLDQLTVTASASADQYRNSTKTGPEIAKELRVDEVLTGKVSWGQGADGKRQVRVVTELVNGNTGAVTWRDTFDADSAAAFDIQGRIATSVAAALGTVVHTDDAKALAGKPTQNAEAYDFYLKGRAIENPSASDSRAAANNYEQAVALDSNFAAAWGGLANSLTLLYTDGTRDAAVARRAKEALDHLLRLASDSASAHMVAAQYDLYVAQDPATARRETLQAFALDSNNVRALSAAANYDISDGNYQAGLGKLSRARKIDPRATGPLRNLARTQIYLGHYDDAVATGRELLALKPTSYDEIEWIVYSHLALGDTAGARLVIGEVLQRLPVTDLVAYFAGYQESAFILDQQQHDLLFRLTPAAFDNDRAFWSQSLATAARQEGDVARSRAYADSSLAISKQQSDASPKDAQLRALYAVMLAYTGRDADATREITQAMSDVVPNTPNDPYVRLQKVRVEITLGQTDKALDDIETLLKTHFYVTPGYLRIDPLFNPLRNNPRFQKMIAPGVTGPTG